MASEYTEKEYIEDTQKHIRDVQELLTQFTAQLQQRAEQHDASKLVNPEKEILRKHSHSLNNCRYGDESYNYHLDKVREALQHHYQHNSHHPEHYEDGIQGMTLVDIVEMFCDWCVTATKYGNSIDSSINIGQERFGMSDDLVRIFSNTARQFNIS